MHYLNLFPQQPCKIGNIIIQILLMKKMDALRGKLSCPISHRLYMEEWDVNSNPELPDFRTHFLAGVRSIWTHAHIGTSLFPIPDSLMVMWLDISVLSHYWYSKGGKNWVKQNSNIQNIELNKQDIELKTSWGRLELFLFFKCSCGVLSLFLSVQASRV